MQRHLWLIVVSLMFFFQMSSGDESACLIKNFRCANNSSDYLIITPSKFEKCAIRLAEYRNAYKGDDVENARVVNLDVLYNEFTLENGVTDQIRIWSAIKWAYDKWHKPIHYIVFIGDDSLSWNETHTEVVNYGPMPSFVDGYTTFWLSNGLDSVFNYSDDYYTTVRCNAIPTETPQYDARIILGRIPCQTADQFNLYIDKVIQFDADKFTSWKNNACVIADDAMQRFNPDPLQYLHFRSAEIISSTLSSKGLFVSKLYLSAYQLDMFSLHSNAREAYFKLANEGNLWTVFFGHGHPGGLTDEFFITAKDIATTFENSRKPTIVLSFSCSNGAFTERFENSMCKQMLFKQNAGAVAYIGSTMLEYSIPNENFARALFDVYDSLPQLSIGKMVAYAKKICRSDDIYHFQLLGDPAIRISGQKVTTSLKPAIPTTYDTRFVGVVSKSAFTTGTTNCVVTVSDTVKLLDDTSRSFIKDSIIARWQGVANGDVFPIPLYPQYTGDVKYRLYISNDSMEGRAGTAIFLDNHSLAFRNPEVRNQLQTPFTVSTTGSIAHFQIPEKMYGSKITISNIAGRLITQLTVGNSREVTVDLQKLAIKSGHFIACVKKDNHEIATTKFILCK